IETDRDLGHAGQARNRPGDRANVTGTAGTTITQPAHEVRPPTLHVPCGRPSTGVTPSHTDLDRGVEPRHQYGSGAVDARSVPELAVRVGPPAPDAPIDPHRATVTIARSDGGDARAWAELGVRVIAVRSAALHGRV